MDVKFTTVKEIYKDREAYIGKTITVGGWVRSIRASKTFGFPSGRIRREAFEFCRYLQV